MRLSNVVEKMSDVVKFTAPIGYFAAKSYFGKEVGDSLDDTILLGLDNWLTISGNLEFFRFLYRLNESSGSLNTVDGTYRPGKPINYWNANPIEFTITNYVESFFNKVQ